MSVIENIDVVMGAQTAELDASIAKEINSLKRFESAARESAKAPAISLPKDSVFNFSFAGAATGLTNFAAGFATLTAAAYAASSAISQVSEAWKEIDESADVGARLGMSFADLNTARESISRSTGMDAGSVDASMQKMNLNLANAVSGGNAELADRLTMLGLDAGELLKAGPLQAIKEIATATKDLSPSDQMIVAYETFGKQGVAMVNALRDGPEAIAAMESKLTAAGANLSDAQVAQIGAAQDAWDDAVMLVTGLFRNLAAESAPVIQLFSEWAGATGSSFTGWGDSLEFVADTTVYLAGVMYDVFEITSLQYTVLSKMANLDFSGIGESITDAVDFSTGEKNVAKLYEKRAQAEEKAAKDAAERKANATMDSEIEAYERAQAEKKRIEEEAQREKQEQLKREGKLKSERDTARDLEAFKSLEDEAKRIKEESMALVSGVDFNKDLFDRRNRFEQAGGDVAEFDKQSAELQRQQKIQFEINEIKREKENKPETKLGAVSAQEGSVEAYKLLLQRDNEQRQIVTEAQRQTELQQRMTELLEKANEKPVQVIGRAR